MAHGITSHERRAERVFIYVGCLWAAVFLLLAVLNHNRDQIQDLQERILALEQSYTPIPAPAVQALVASYAYVTLTAYASLEAQTDSTPFVTARGTQVQPGTLAASRDLLASAFPYGTRVRIVAIDRSPGCNAWLPGQQGILPDVLTVDDTMHRRKTQQLDVWMPDNDLALRWGRCRGIAVAV